MPGGDPRFKHVGWTIGNHCNATCRHCYSWKVRKDSRAFLTESEVDRIVEQLVRLGVDAVNLGGNEPIYTHGPELQRTILPYVIRKLDDAHIGVGFTTNGVTFKVLEERYPRELRLVNDIDFSLDSPFWREHDLNRGARLFKLVVEGVERAREIGIAASIIFCGMRGNFDIEHLSAFLALTKMLDCEFRINTLKPIEARLIPETPTPSQFYEGFTFLMDNTSCITLGESCLTAITGEGSRGCPCGTASFRINSKTEDGRVSVNPCVYLHDFKVGDLLTEDVLEMVHRPQFARFAERHNQIPAACHEADCQYLELCRGGCAARTYLHTGSFDSRDPYCPHEYVRRCGSEPPLPKGLRIGCSDGFRVHDDYLCTWIGKVNASFRDARFSSLRQLISEGVSAA